MTAVELMERHVRSFNAAVADGDWEPMLARFTPESELHFENVPAGPFVGLDAIRSAYAAEPPSDTIQLLGVQENDEHTVVAAFAWSKGGTGRMVLRHDRGAVERLTVIFDVAAGSSEPIASDQPA
jgi:steroid delta-isomerase